MAVTLGTGRPYAAAIINTDPKQLRFVQKASEDYTIRVVYVPYPPVLATIDAGFYVPEALHQALYYKFVAMVAEDMGEDQLMIKFNALYQAQIERDKAKHTSMQLTSLGVEYSGLGDDLGHFGHGYRR